jgi:PAS domain S-box-containing protein
MASIMHLGNSLSATQDSYLVNRDHYFVTRPRFGDQNVILKQTISTAGVTDCLTAHNDVSVYNNYEGIPVMGAYRWIPEQQLCLVTEVHQAELLAPVLAMRKTMVGIGGGLALMVGFLALGFARTLTRPLQELVSAAEEIGRGNLTYRSRLKSGDELGRLAGAFNHMAGQRQQVEEELRQHRDRLELLVTERTHNLEMANAQLQQGIAEYKQAEIALFESEERYRSLFQNNHAVMLLIDPETGDIVDANPAACTFYGYSPQEMKQWNITNINQLSQEQVFEEMEKARREQRQQFFFRHRLASGEIREVEVYSGPIYFQGKQFLYSIVHDITQRKQIELALIESESRYRILFENSPISLWEEDFTAVHRYFNRLKSSGVVDFRAYFESHAQAVRDCLALIRIIDVNATTVEMYQAQHKAQLLANLDQVITDEARQTFREELISLAEGQTDFLAETVQQTLQGQKIDVSLKLTVPPHAQSDLSRVFISLTNITQLNQVQEQLQQYIEELARSNAELEQFAYIASHDLQEPLRMISSYLQLLARRYQGKLDQEADDFIAYAVDGAARMKRLINDLLAYSRLSRQGQPLVLTDSEAVFQQTLATLELAIQESGATISHDPMPTIMADEIQLEQLFRNLIGNALKFCGDQPPKIHVGVTPYAGDGQSGPANAYWLFSVADNGIGFEQEFSERIFVIFQRLHNRDTYPGTGIGLANCKKIVERHGGRIWAEARPGQGATFYFTIPMSERNEI